jgi:glycosyltransferase involved in cell wall biosynthesis
MRFGPRVWRTYGPLLRSANLLVVHDIYLLPLGVALSRRWRIPIVYDAHEDFAVMEHGRLSDWVLHAAAATETLLARQAAFVVVPGHVRRQRWVQAGFPPPVVLANTGVPSSEVQSGDTNDDTIWDLVYCGTLDASRRPDLLIELARRRPDLRIAVAGSGRAADSIREAAAALENLDFLGWVDDPDAVLRRSHAVYYGLDPENPYAKAACPNNVYQAIRARRPIIFFCDGEAAELAEKFRVGLRVSASVEALAAAVDAATDGTHQWDFDEALRAIEIAGSGREYVDAVVTALKGSAPRALWFDPIR